MLWTEGTAKFSGEMRIGTALLKRFKTEPEKEALTNGSVTGIRHQIRKHSKVWPISIDKEGRKAGSM